MKKLLRWLSLLLLCSYAALGTAYAGGVPKTGAWHGYDGFYSDPGAACADVAKKQGWIYVGLADSTITATSAGCRGHLGDPKQTIVFATVTFQYSCPTLYPVTGPDGLCWKTTPVKCADGSYADSAQFCPPVDPPPTSSTSSTTGSSTTSGSTTTASTTGSSTTSSGDPTGTGTSTTSGDPTGTGTSTGSSTTSGDGSTTTTTTTGSSSTTTGATSTTTGATSTTTGATSTSTGATTTTGESSGATSTGSLPTGTSSTGNGGTTSTGTTGTTGDPDSSNLCKLNPSLNICQNSSVSGSCAATTCTGDAITCAILQAQRKAECEATDRNTHSDLATAILGGSDPQAENLPSLDKPKIVELGDPPAQPGAWLSGSCFADKSFSLMGQNLVISFSMLCEGLIAFRGLVMLLAGLASFRMVSRSVLSA